MKRRPQQCAAGEAKRSASFDKKSLQAFGTRWCSVSDRHFQGRLLLISPDSHYRSPKYTCVDDNSTHCLVGGWNLRQPPNAQELRFVWNSWWYEGKQWESDTLLHSSSMFFPFWRKVTCGIETVRKAVKSNSCRFPLSMADTSEHLSLVD